MKGKIKFIGFVLVFAVIMYSVVQDPKKEEPKEPKEPEREKVLNWNKVDFGNYTVKLYSINKISADHYVVDFNIQYKKGKIGFEHDVKLTSGDYILNSTVESFDSQAFESNRYAKISLRVPSNEKGKDYDGIIFLDQKTNNIRTRFKMYK